MAAKHPVETVRLVKELLWKGRPQEQITSITGVGQSTISRIKLGTAHGDIPWPDGSVGAMPARDSGPQEPNWSADARRFLSFPEAIQERILGAVNARRIDAGIPPIPNAASEYVRFLNADPLDLEFEASAMVQARRAEDTRLAEIMRDFDEMLLEEEMLMREERLMQALHSTRDRIIGSFENRTALAPQDDLRYDKLPWISILERAPRNPVVVEAASASPALREAVCIVFYQLRNAPETWASERIHTEIRRLAKRLESLPALMQRLEEEEKSAVE